VNTAATPIAARALSDDTSPSVVAVERLEASRQRLRRHLLELNGSRNGANEPAASRRPHVLLDSLRSIPGIGVVVDTVSNWWSRHPLRVVVSVLMASAASVTQPVTQRHPKWALFAALAAGGLLMWARPWRFAPLRRAVYAGLLPQLMSTVMSRMPSDGWMNLVDSLLRRKPEAVPAAVRMVQPSFHRGSPPGSDPARTSPLH
jgi:hypothetical protein